MYYEIHGRSSETDVLVLIHGGGSTISTNFGKILPLLAAHHMVVAMELQAHGHTGDRDAAESFEQDADDVAELLQQLGISKASLLGFSNGGNTAMQVAIRHPQLVDKLIITSSFYKRDGLLPGFFEGMQGVTLQHMPQQLQDAFMAIQHDEQKLLNMFDKDKARMLAFKDWEEEMLQAIQVPVMVIAGDQDIILAQHTVELAKCLRARLMILPSDHGGYIGAVESTGGNLSQLACTAAIVNDFLQADITAL